MAFTFLVVIPLLQVIVDRFGFSTFLAGAETTGAGLTISGAVSP
jgi:hypothetical protein